MSLTSAEVMDESALLLNDSAKITFTYLVQAAWLKRAINEFSDELAVNNIPLLTKIATVVPVVAGTTTVPLPADALLPILLEERTSGSLDAFVAMNPVESIPTGLTPEDSFGIWAFQGTLLNSVPVIDVPNASSSREVRVTYQKFLPYAGLDGTTDFSTSLTVTSKRFLSAKTAEFIARFVLQNDKRAKELKDESAKSLYRIIQIWVKYRQTNPIRKSRYRNPTSSGPGSSAVAGGTGGVDLTNVAFVNGLNVFSLLQTLQSGELNSSVSPFIRFNETDGGVNLKNWDIFIDGQIFAIRSLSDAFGFLLYLLQVDRSGNLTATGTISTLGGSVKFPATQVPSAGVNDLDDYEEGTWTPALTFGGASVGLTYGTRTGTYTKIGNLVHAEFLIVLTAKGSSVGVASISGLPFSGLGNPPGILALIAATFAGITGAPYIEVISSSISLIQSSAVGGIGIADTAFTNTSSFRGSIDYRV